MQAEYLAGFTVVFLSFSVGAFQVPDEADVCRRIRDLGGVYRFDESKSVDTVILDSVPDFLQRRQELSDGDLYKLNLSELSCLRHLTLKVPKMTDQGMSILRKLDAQLLTLEISSNKITDAGLIGVFQRQKDLRCIFLIGTPTGDSTLVQIAKLTKLWALFLDDTKVTDKGLASLVGLQRLTHLSLTRTSISDAGIMSLVGSPSIKCLDLDHTHVSDRAIPALSSFQSLETLNIRSTKISEQGYNMLKASLPQTTIRR